MKFRTGKKNNLRAIFKGYNIPIEKIKQFNIQQAKARSLKVVRKGNSKTLEHFYKIFKTKKTLEKKDFKLTKQVHKAKMQFLDKRIKQLYSMIHHHRKRHNKNRKVVPMT